MVTSAHLIIIGAGPAGLLAAIAAGTGALLIERNPFAGKKLLLSGSGQCNFTNDLAPDLFLKHCGKHSAFLKPALYSLDNHAFIELLAQNDCPALTRPDGKVFPASLHSADVRDALLRQVLTSGAKIRYGTRITKVEKQEVFVLESDTGERFTSTKLILAGGGSSYPQTGSDGSSYSLARALGHTIGAPKPALAAVDIADFGVFRVCAGVSLKQVRARFQIAGKAVSAQGDLLFTHTGLSGPLILDNSYQFQRGTVLQLTLVPRAEDRIPEILALNPRQSLLSALKRFGIAESLLRAILASASIDPAGKCSELRKETRCRIVQILSHLELKVSAVESLRTAMATSGGIPLSEVKANSLASKLCEGLHFAGEILDYNLPTGGFNIQIAASTGYLAGKAATK